MWSNFKVAGTTLNEWMKEWIIIEDWSKEQSIYLSINQKTISQSIHQINQAINRPANLSVNQSTNQSINQAINHSSQPSTNLSANQWINHKSLRNKSTNQNNHQSLHQSTMPFINQTTIKTKRVQTLPGNWVITTHNMILLIFPPPHPRQCWSPNIRKDDMTIQHCFGKRGGGRELSFFLLNFCLSFFSTIFSRL